MSLKQIVSRRKVTASIAGGVAAIALAVGGSAIADANSSSGTSPSANPAAVIPFQRGQAGATKVVGQVPASFAAGAGTIVTGTAADKAKAAAQAAYPGGTINRVVLLSDGQYNVHVIGVNWPHHVFVSKDFKVIGAE
ncbi:MAG: hypothetical protein QOF40_1086 [Actinomycetota bacterium]|jgi:hypothetical protein|nr:hypothetical protein [Actinomycetota bacterium]